MTRISHALIHPLLVGLLLIGWTGCNTSPTPDGAAVAESDDHHDDHDHAHEHEAVGPNGGHVIELNGGNLHAEWLHDDATGEVTFFILDEAMKPAANLDISQVQVTTKIAGGDVSEYDFTRVPPGDDSSDAVQYSLTDQQLLTALKVGKGVECTLSVTVAGQPTTAVIEHHDHDHGHHH
jgi:hypothetical protein